MKRLNCFFYSVGDVCKTNSKNLPLVIQEHINKYLDQNSKEQSLCAWNALEQLLQTKCRLSLQDLDISFTKNGKPVSQKIFFSLSHTKMHYAVCISNKPCGIDIEEETEIKKAEQISKFVFGKATKMQSEFFKEWTKHEATAKLLDVATTSVKNQDISQIYYSFFSKNDAQICIASTSNKKPIKV